MRRNEFIEEMKAVASEFGTPTIQEIVKPTETYTGMAIKKTGIPSPIVNLDRLYRSYEDGISLDRCKAEVKRILTIGMEDPTEFDMKNIGNWDIMKNLLYLKLMNTATDELAEPVEDMFLIPYIRVTATDNASIKVVPELLNIWGVSKKEVFAQAKVNQFTMRPAKIVDLATELGMPVPIDTYIVTTENGVFGASAIFYAGVFDELYDLLGEFYILPSSVHEMLVIPKRNSMSISDLKEMVTSINETEVDESDRLSNSVYYFDFETRDFRKVG